MQEHIDKIKNLILGEITAAKSVREFFSTDGSVFQVTPSFVIYPKNEADVRKIVHYLAIAAQDGKGVGLTARGKGTDQGGGALGAGAVMVFPAHMKSLVALDRRTITVQPGMIYAHLQGILHSHDRFLPPYPASIDFASIGGAVANNSAGEKTVKYGSTRDYVEKLRVVLSNGEVIETRRLSRKELEAKKRQDDFEGHIYRNVDYLLEENAGLIKESYVNVSKNSAGYDVWDVKRRDGSFDLSQLIVGSQGTLGVVTEATLSHRPYSQKNTLVVGYFETIAKAAEATKKIMALRPSALEVVDSHLLRFLQEHHSHLIDGVLPERMPEIVLFAEFDDLPLRKQSTQAHKVEKIYSHLAFAHHTLTDSEQQTRYWRLRRSAAAVIWMDDGPKKALPIIEDGVVPVEKMPEFLHKVYELFDKYKLDIAVWGHAGNANFHLQPFLNLSSEVDRKKVFNLMNDFYRMVIALGGSTCGEHNDGRLRAPYLKRLYGLKMYELFCEIKQVFDPLGFLNPEVKLGVTISDVSKKLRKEYSMKHLRDVLPNSYNN